MFDIQLNNLFGCSTVYVWDTLSWTLQGDIKLRHTWFTFWRHKQTQCYSCKSILLEKKIVKENELKKKLANHPPAFGLLPLWLSKLSNVSLSPLAIPTLKSFQVLSDLPIPEDLMWTLRNSLLVHKWLRPHERKWGFVPLSLRVQSNYVRIPQFYNQVPISLKSCWETLVS